MYALVKTCVHNTALVGLRFDGYQRVGFPDAYAGPILEGWSGSGHT